jgi:hypothetical protein
MPAAHLALLLKTAQGRAIFLPRINANQHEFEKHQRANDLNCRPLG